MRQSSLKEEVDNVDFLQKLIDAIPVPIFYKDTRGIYLGCNRAFADFLGLSKEAIVGKTVYDVAPKDLSEIYSKADEELFRLGGVQTYESSVQHADGTRHHVIFNKAIFFNRNGIIGGLIGSIFDITELKEAQEQLRTSEEKYRRIFESFQDIYYEVGIDGSILEISPSVEKYFPFKREELLGRSIYEFYADPEKRNALLKIIQEAGRVTDYEIQLKNEEGSLFTCSITAAILPGEGACFPRIVGCLRDISERKRCEDALKEREEELSIKSRNLEELNAALRILLKQREEDKKELEENILNNVKTIILPCIEKLKEGPLNESQSACLDNMKTHVQEIASPFLHRISQAYFNLTPQEIRVAYLVRDGKTTKEAAKYLAVSMKTIDSHRGSIRKKLGIKNKRTSLRSFLLRFS